MAKENKSASTKVDLAQTKAFELKKKTQVCCGKEVDVMFRKLPERPAMGQWASKAKAEGRLPIFLEDGFGNWPELNPRTYEAFPGVICEQDVEIVMRDGVKTYADIYRPKDAVNIPCIIGWSWFGKRQCTDDPDPEEVSSYQTYGVPFGSYSKHGGFEVADPEYWCHKGYAICKYDPRGTNNSEGDILYTTQQEARDMYDVIEFLGVQPWCNGKIGMSGDSGPAVAQWKAASQKPPHLAAIAPWEGVTDTYRELICIGGIPECGFNPFLCYSFYGANDMEDLYQNTKIHPLFDEYWEEKLPLLEEIDVPAYITAGWTHFHLRGTVNGYRHIRSKQKWIRFYRDFEWENYYNGENIADLNKFFDRYLKGIRNGWESTPKVRLDVMDAYDFDYRIRRPEEDFPIPRTEYRKYYLDASRHSMGNELPASCSQVSYDAKKGRTTFDIKFDEDTELTGYMKLHLWVEAEGNDDMDLFVAIQKLDKDGKFLPTNIIGAPHPGTVGRLRVSLRELDEEKSTDFNPVQTFAHPEKLQPGEIVPVDVEIWPLSRIWHKGEQLRVEIMGRFEREDWFEPFDYDTINEGKHIIHTGGVRMHDFVVDMIGVPACPTTSYVPDLWAEEIGQLIRKYEYKRIGLVGPSIIPMSFTEYFRKYMPELELVDATALVDNRRQCKSPYERKTAGQCVQIIDELMAAAPSVMRTGQNLREIGRKLRALADGYDCMDLNIMLGRHPSMPMFSEWIFTDEEIVNAGDCIELMIEVSGPTGVWGEAARVFSMGKPGEEIVKTAELAFKMQDYLAKQMIPGADPGIIFENYGKELNKNGFPAEKRFCCHGQGYDVVEMPFVRPENHIPLKKDAFIAIHPSIYDPARSTGCFECDNFLITDSGAKRLNITPRTVIEVSI